MSHMKMKEASSSTESYENNKPKKEKINTKSKVDIIDNCKLDNLKVHGTIKNIEFPVTKSNIDKSNHTKKYCKSNYIGLLKKENDYFESKLKDPNYMRKTNYNVSSEESNNIQYKTIKSYKETEKEDEQNQSQQEENDKIYTNQDLSYLPYYRHHDYVNLDHQNFDENVLTKTGDKTVKNMNFDISFPENISAPTFQQNNIGLRNNSELKFRNCNDIRKKNQYSHGLKSIEAVLGILKLKRIYQDKTYFEQGYKYKTDFQIKVLNDVLKITHYPGAQTRDTLAILLNLNPRSIQIWFQNARQSCEKKMSKDEIKGKKVNNHIDLLSLVDIYNKHL